MIPYYITCSPAHLIIDWAAGARRVIPVVWNAVYSHHARINIKLQAFSIELSLVWKRTEPKIFDATIAQYVSTTPYHHNILEKNTMCVCIHDFPLHQ